MTNSAPLELSRSAETINAGRWKPCSFPSGWLRSTSQIGCEYCGVPIGIYLALVGGAALVTLVGVGVVVALAAAERRADLATMAAVGAPPRRRRSIAGWQALVVGGLGTALGIALGTYYAYLIWPAIGAPEFFVPWEAMALIGLGVPLLAAVVAVLFIRSKLPMVRRIE